MADRLHHVCFAESDPAVENERVIESSRLLRRRMCSGRSELIVVADYEAIEGVSLIQARGRKAASLASRSGIRWPRAWRSLLRTFSGSDGLSKTNRRRRKRIL